MLPPNPLFLIDDISDAIALGIIFNEKEIENER